MDGISENGREADITELTRKLLSLLQSLRMEMESASGHEAIQSIAADHPGLVEIVDRMSACTSPEMLAEWLVKHLKELTAASQGVRYH